MSRTEQFAGEFSMIQGLATEFPRCSVFYMIRGGDTVDNGMMGLTFAQSSPLTVLTSLLDALVAGEVG